MELQKVFKRSYMEQLKRHIHVEDYQKDEFPFDPSKTRPIANVYKPDGLLEKLDANDDFKSAIELYTAYKGVSSLLASLPDLWVYLAHADLFPYVQARHSDVMKENADVNYIYQHWFRNDVSIFRMVLPGLWWSVKLSIDEERSNPGHLQKRVAN